jgi:hypothetical protein
MREIILSGAAGVVGTILIVLTIQLVQRYQTKQRTIKRRLEAS